MWCWGTQPGCRREPEAAPEAEHCLGPVFCLVPGSRASPSPPGLVPCSVHWAPRPPPWQQLEPEGPGGRAGECWPRSPCAGRSAGVLPGAAGQLCLPDPCRRTRLGRPALCPHPPLSRQDLASVLFSDAPLPQPATLPARPLPPAGTCRPLVLLSPPKGCAGSAGPVPLAGAVGVWRPCWPGGLLGVRAGCRGPR